MARRRKRPLPPEPPPEGTPAEVGRPEPSPAKSRRRRLAGVAWRMFPFRGRYLSATTRYVFERLPDAPQAFRAADIALLCVEADQALDPDSPCNPAETIDLLTSRGLVTWTDDGFVKKAGRLPRRPRA